MFPNLLLFLYSLSKWPQDPLGFPSQIASKPCHLPRKYLLNTMCFNVTVTRRVPWLRFPSSLLNPTHSISSPSARSPLSLMPQCHCFTSTRISTIASAWSPRCRAHHSSSSPRLPIWPHHSHLSDRKAPKFSQIKELIFLTSHEILKFYHYP